MIKALLYEYSSVGRPSEIRLSFEFHCKCKAHFEVEVIAVIVSTLAHSQDGICFFLSSLQ